MTQPIRMVLQNTDLKNPVLVLGFGQGDSLCKTKEDKRKQDKTRKDKRREEKTREDNQEERRPEKTRDTKNGEGVAFFLLQSRELGIVKGKG